MNAYVDTSVLLRIALGEPAAFKGWRKIERAVSSALIRLEALRTIDRARITLGLADQEVSRRRALIFEFLAGFDIVPISARVVERAAQPFPTVVGILDAIHLATVVLAAGESPDLVLVTHDEQLATAARALGLTVHGVAPTTE